MLEEAFTYWREHLMDYTYAFAIVLGFFPQPPGAAAAVPAVYRPGQEVKAGLQQFCSGHSQTSQFLYSGNRSLPSGAVFTGGTAYSAFFTKVYRSLVIIFISQGLYNLADSTSGLLMDFGASITGISFSYLCFPKLCGS